MALLIPDVLKECTASERQVLRRLSRELPEEWVVIHSLGLTKHKKKIWGEIDCAVLSEKGIFAVEVKGGHVSCRDGVWTFSGPDGRESYTKPEGPFEQAKDAWFALKKTLDDTGSFKNLLGGYGVVMPYETFTQTGPEIEPAVLLDSRGTHRDMGFYIGQLSTHWSGVYAAQGRRVRAPTKSDIQAIRKLLRPDVHSAFRLGSYLTALETELLQLTEQQIRAARGLQRNSRTVTTGSAGTGKTLVALDHARRLAEGGRRVLYLCYNKLLAEHVVNSLAAKPPGHAIAVRHIHGLYKEIIDKAELGARLATPGLSDDELFGQIYPHVFYEAASTVGIEPYDAVFVDEAQDLMTIQNLDALDLLIIGGLDDGRWHFFLDPFQDIYGKHAELAQARLADAGYAQYDLTQNCRCTKQIALQASILSSIDLEIDGAIEGPACDPVFVERRADIPGRVCVEVEKLLAEGVESKDIVLLSLRRLEKSAVAEVHEIAGLPIVDLSSGRNGCGLHFSTVHGFKGLERKVVVLFDLERLGERDSMMLHYVALTRAQTMLRIVLCASERPAYHRLAQEFGKRLANRAAT